jgi:hypothetical protein
MSIILRACATGGEVRQCTVAAAAVALRLLPAAWPWRHRSRRRMGRQSQIEHLMRKTWERADAPPSVQPVVVVADYAITGWI